MRTSELTGPALDWAAAMCEGKRPSLFIFKQTGKLASEHNYSTNWAQGGPIIERDEIETRTAHSGGWMANRARTKGYFECGPTPLIAAMRCYVASKLGDTVDIPKELL